MSAAAGDRPAANRGPWPDIVRFGAVTLAASVPFWVAGSRGRLPAPLSSLPISALGVAVPAAAAFALARRSGAMADLIAQFRPRGGSRLCGATGWWIAAGLAATVPLAVNAFGQAWTAPDPAALGALALLYVAGAFGEEIGWTGYLQPRLVEATGSIVATAGLLGAYWLAWHLVPYLQTGQSVAWVALQSAQLLLTRAAIVGLTVGSGGGVLLAVTYHALYNLAWWVLDHGGVAYDPARSTLVLLPVAAVALVAGARGRSGPAR